MSPKKVSQKTQQEVVPVEPVIENIPEQESEIVETPSVEQGLLEMKNYISLLKTQMKEIEQTLKMLTVQYKQESKKRRKTKRQSGDQPKKGEFKPVKISTQLADFLGLNADEPIKRDQVSKLVYSYIIKHKLYFDDKPHTFMKPDSKLKKLFGDFSHPLNSKRPELGTGLSIYNMQKYLQQHFTPI